MTPGIVKKHIVSIENLFWRFLQVAGKQGVSFTIFFITGYFLSSSEFGIYNYIFSVIFIFLLISDFGIAISTSKYVTEKKSINDISYKNIFISILLVMIILSFISSFILLFLNRFILKEYKIYTNYLVFLLFLIPLTSLNDGIYRGLKRFKILSIVSLFSGAITILSSIFLIKLYGITGALLSNVILYLANFIILTLCNLENISLKIDKKIIISILKYSILIGIANLGIYLFTKADIFILGQYGFLSEISYFEISNKLFMLLSIPFTVFSDVLAPNVVNNNILDKANIIKSKFKIYVIISFIIGIIISVLLYFFIPFIINVFYSQYNVNLFYVFFNSMLIILPFRIVGSILVNGFLIPLNFAYLTTVNNVIFGVINIILNIIFIYLFGAIGVVISTVLLGILSILSIIIIFYKKYIMEKDYVKNLKLLWKPL